MPQNWWDEFPTANQAQPAAPSLPRVIEGPPREPPPQTPANAQKDVFDARKAQLELEALERKAADPSGALGVEQAKATGFYSRAAKANQEYEAMGVGAPSFGTQIAKGLPEAIKGYVVPQDRLAADANATGFISAALRYESGAAIPPEELNNAYRLYFPLPGEGPDVIEQKRRLRSETIEGLKLGSGQGAKQVQLAQPDQGSESQPAQNQQITAADQVYARPDPGSIEINKGTWDRVKDPALAGVAAQVNEAVKAGAGPKDLAAIFNQYGIPLAGIMPSALKVLAWRDANPNYKGDYDTSDLENRFERLNPVRAAAGSLADTSFGAAAIGTANAMTGGYLDELAPGDTDLNNLGKQIVAQRHPLATLGGNALGGVAVGLGASGGLAAAGVPALGRAAPLLDMAYGGIYGSGESNENRGLGALTGAGLGLAGGEIGRRGVNALSSAVSPTGGKLAPLYAEGVQPSIGQRMGASDNWLGRTANRAEQVFGSVPVLGGIQRSSRNKAVTQMQTGAFNQALREIDVQLPADVRSGTAAHGFMQKAFDDAYDSARAGLQFKPDTNFATDFGQVLNDVDLLGADSQRAFEKIAKDVGIRLKGRGGTLTGADYKTMVSRIDRKARAIRSNPSGDGELADALEGLSAAMDNGARRISDPGAVALLDKADRGYAKAVIVEDAARRRGGEAGEFSGTQLDAAVQNMSGGRRSRAFLAGRANMQDYAAGAKALGDTVPDSGTPERLMTGAAVVGGVGAASNFVSPLAALPYAANTVANLPGVRTGVNAALRPRPKTRAAADAIRRRAYLGGLFGVPLAIEAGQ